MQPFSLELPGEGNVAGICSLPFSVSNTSPKSRPLIIGLHGGGYNSEYFNAHPAYTAAIPSTAYQVPFVAIDRPCYGGTSSFLPIPRESSFPLESGKWLHERIIPAIWREFGVPQACTCVVLLCHSLGVAAGVPAAAMCAADTDPAYPLGGIIASGLGSEAHKDMKHAGAPQANFGPDHIKNPAEGKDQVMFAPGTVDPEILELSEKLNQPMPVEEVRGMLDTWIPQWRHRWAPEITVPVMFALAGLDKFYEPSQKHLETCVKALSKSPRVDGSVINGAPHCIELSYWSHGWYARCFGFALECAAAHTTKS